jgi:hypothetical protein
MDGVTYSARLRYPSIYSILISALIQRDSYVCDCVLAGSRQIVRNHADHILLCQGSLLGSAMKEGGRREKCGSRVGGSLRSSRVISLSHEDKNT